MHESFFALADGLFGALRGEEIASLSVGAEASSFARLNGARVRQAGDVRQLGVELSLVDGGRHANASLTLRGDESDGARLGRALGELRETVAAMPVDPHLLYCTAPREHVELATDELPVAADAVDAIVAAGAGHDLVGIWASGAIHRGYFSSLGHRLWKTSHSFHFDYSLYAQGDKAAKGMYAGTRFDAAAVQDKLTRAAAQVEILRRPVKRVDPGRYRVYLTPAALADILGLLVWDAFGVKGHRTKETPLLRMLDGATLDPKVTLVEDAESGVGPSFLRGGFVRPPQVPLIAEGRLVGALVSPRSAREYDLEPNADRTERPSALAMGAGALPESEALARLGTGIYVTNTWYTNYSDPMAARITGMTRFATTWVENGEPVAPLAVMRFDDTLYRMLGSELEALTAEREWLLDGGTYGERSTDSMLLPGALLREMTFTL
jgi:predicted Zn-dependent protease